jgi:hypothetical protein
MGKKDRYCCSIQANWDKLEKLKVMHIGALTPLPTLKHPRRVLKKSIKESCPDSSAES